MKAMLIILVVLYIIDDIYRLSYDYVSQFIPVTGAGWICIKLLILWLTYLAYLKCKYNKIKGEITSTQIQRADGSQRISLDSITSAKGKFILGNLNLDVKLTVSGLGIIGEYCICGNKLIPLINTKLNNWLIGRADFTIQPSTANEQVLVQYVPIGRYALGRRSEDILCYYLFMVSILTTGLFYPVLFGPVFGLCIFICLAVNFLHHYSKVRVGIKAKEISVSDDNGYAVSMVLSDVIKGEKGLFQYKIIGGNDQVIYAPRACYLLPELIEELAGLKNGHTFKRC